MNRRDFLKGTALATWAAAFGVTPSELINIPQSVTKEQRAAVDGEKDGIYDCGTSPYFLEGGWALPSPIVFTYTLLDANTSLPCAGIELFFTSDADGDIVVWTGMTDEAGVARDALGNPPCLFNERYFVWRKPREGDAILTDVVLIY